jgi:hypothetical protein
MNGASPEAIAHIRAQSEEIEKNAFVIQGQLEEAARRVYASDKAAAMRMLENYTKGIYLSSLAAMERIIHKKAGKS